MSNEIFGIAWMIGGITACVVLLVIRTLKYRGAREKEKADYSCHQHHVFIIRADALLQSATLLAALSLIVPTLLGCFIPVLAIFFGAYGLLLLWLFVSNCLWRVTVKDDGIIWRDGRGKNREYLFSQIEEAVPGTRRQGLFRFRFSDGQELTIERRTPGLITLVRRCADRTGRGRMEYWDK